MLRAINVSNGPVSAAPAPVREAQATGLPTGAGTPANTAAPVQAVRAEAPAVSNVLSFRYNSTEFVYRQDIGKIVLIGQSPETGEREIQIPSEEALRAYERTMRSEERQTLLAGGQAQTSTSSGGDVPAPPQQVATPIALPNVQQAIGAVFGANQSSAVVSVSA